VSGDLVVADESLEWIEPDSATLLKRSVFPSFRELCEIFGIPPNLVVPADEIIVPTFPEGLRPAPSPVRRDP
jgi:hypothetical protein